MAVLTASSQEVHELAQDAYSIAAGGAAELATAQNVVANVRAVLVLDRMRMSAFTGTSLDIMLRNLGVTHVVIVGVWTNMAVEHSARDAAEHDYDVTVVSDATSSVSADWQRAALGYA